MATAVAETEVATEVATEAVNAAAGAVTVEVNAAAGVAHPEAAHREAARLAADPQEVAAASTPAASSSGWTATATG